MVLNYPLIKRTNLRNKFPKKGIGVGPGGKLLIASFNFNILIKIHENKIKIKG